MLYIIIVLVDYFSKIQKLKKKILPNFVGKRLHIVQLSFFPSNQFKIIFLLTYNYLLEGCYCKKKVGKSYSSFS